MVWSWAYHRKLWVRRDFLLRQKFASMELKRLTLKALVADRSQPLEYRGYYNHLLVKLPKKLSISFFRNYCHRTGSGRSVFRTFKYSRHEVKRLSNKGLVSGFRKSSF